MNNRSQHIKVLVSGGGTGGHIFPAIAIADEIKKRYANASFLFVGANDRMEMERVPKAGYSIKGLWISGIQRKLTLDNLMFPFKLISSLMKAGKIVKEFKPDVAVGTGGYASGPALKAAKNAGVPILLQEQNSFAGITNKWLGKQADKICVAYDKMDRFFKSEVIVRTGNPIRQSLLEESCSVEEARAYFGLETDKPTLLIVGGSLGARTFNETMLANQELLESAEYQVIWQIGKGYIEEYGACPTAEMNHVKALAFLDDMGKAYKAADVVISRAGGAISELSALGKAVILVPSPNVAEDHQTKNAMNLVDKDAAILVKDSEALTDLLPKAASLLMDAQQKASLSDNILKLAKPNATSDIVDEVEKLLESRNK